MTLVDLLNIPARRRPANLTRRQRITFSCRRPTGPATGASRRSGRSTPTAPACGGSRTSRGAAERAMVARRIHHRVPLRRQALRDAGRRRHRRGSSRSTHGRHRDRVAPRRRVHLFSRARAADRRRARAPAPARRHASCSTNPGCGISGRLRVADGAETRITSGTDYIFAYRHRGQRRAHHHQPPPDAVCRPTPTGSSCGASQPTAAAPVQLTNNTIPEEDGELSPDGSQVLFCRARERPAGAVLQRQPVSGARRRGARSRALLPDFPHEVLRAGWAADSKSIWMVVNMGVHSELFQVDLAIANAAADHQRRPCARSAVLERRRRVGTCS